MWERIIVDPVGYDVKWTYSESAKFQVGDVPDLSKRLQWKGGQDATHD